MTFKVKNLGTIDVTYENLHVNNYEVNDNMVMSLVLKATNWFTKYTLTELQEWGYDRMYEELIDQAAKRGLI